MIGRSLIATAWSQCDRVWLVEMWQCLLQYDVSMYDASLYPGLTLQAIIYPGKCGWNCGVQLVTHNFSSQKLWQTLTMSLGLTKCHLLSALAPRYRCRSPRCTAPTNGIRANDSRAAVRPSLTPSRSHSQIKARGVIRDRALRDLHYTLDAFWILLFFHIFWFLD